jgi:hypothetical protein
MIQIHLNFQLMQISKHILVKYIGLIFFFLKNIFTFNAFKKLLASSKPPLIYKHIIPLKPFKVFLYSSCCGCDAKAFKKSKFSKYKVFFFKGYKFTWINDSFNSWICFKPLCNFNTIFHMCLHS